MHLRELSALTGYRIAASQSQAPIGRLAGLAYVFGTWHVGDLIAAPDGSAASELRIPTDSVVEVDDATRTIRAGLSPAELRAASSRGARVQYAADAAALVGCRVGGHDGEAGVVTDVLVNVRFWQLRYLVIRHGGRTVLTDMEWCDEVDPDERLLTLGVPSRTVATAPPYPGLGAMCRGDEAVLYRHYTSRW